MSAVICPKCGKKLIGKEGIGILMFDKNIPNTDNVEISCSCYCKHCKTNITHQVMAKVFGIESETLSKQIEDEETEKAKE